MKSKITNLLIVLGPFLGLILIFAFFCALAPSSFHSFYNVKTIITQSVIVSIGALGMTLVIISGGIDLSVGSQIALCTVVTASVLDTFGGTEGQALGLLPALAAAVCGVAACAACGAAGGSLTTTLGIVPFIVTLGIMQIARGLAKWIGKEQTIMTPQNPLMKLMDVDPTPSWLVFAPGVWLTLLLLAVTWVVLNRTIFGRRVHAIGSNEKTAVLCGVRTKFNKIMIYTVCGAFTGVAGIMQYANLSVGDPTAASGMELDIIAAVVIGGGSLTGGEGGALGSVIGALIMAVLRNGCNMLGVPNYVQDIIIGSIIIAAVAVDVLRKRVQSA
jgi:ribose transport system permease protein